MNVGDPWIIGLLTIVAAVNIAQFGHQMWFARKFATHRALPADRAHGGSNQ